jgi:hypothetical protein
MGEGRFGEEATAKNKGAAHIHVGLLWHLVNGVLTTALTVLALLGLHVLSFAASSTFAIHVFGCNCVLSIILGTIFACARAAGCYHRSPFLWRVQTLGTRLLVTRSVQAVIAVGLLTCLPAVAIPGLISKGVLHENAAFIVLALAEFGIVTAVMVMSSRVAADKFAALSFATRSFRFPLKVQSAGGRSETVVLADTGDHASTKTAKHDPGASMMVRTMTCPCCGATLGIRDEHAGMLVDCPVCQRSVEIAAGQASVRMTR